MLSQHKLFGIKGLTGQPLKDISSAIAKLDQLPSSQFKQVMEKTPGLAIAPVMTALKKVFLKP